ncbi:hypothetical protein [Lentzea sp. NPDC051838]|uniref:hypothetical protein n=1 Tax=Lentzea sp. NPDC051838 TaxID=3154849 RepID=UPI0034396522
MGEHSWRAGLLVGGLLICGLTRDTSFFGIIPLMMWCALGRTWWTGAGVGLVLLGLLAWFAVPRNLQWSGPWVPTRVESFWLYAVLSVVVCLIGVLVQRGEGVTWTPWLLAVLVMGFAGAGVLKLGDYEGNAPHDESVLPGPSALQLNEGDVQCGSGHGAKCAREAEATGERAGEVMRAHLTSYGYTSASTTWTGNERLCRTSGLVSVREVCAELKDLSATSLRVRWYVNRA